VYRQAVLEAVQRPPFSGPWSGRHEGTLHAAAMRHSWCQGTAGVSLSCLAVSTLLEQPDLLHGLDATLAEAAAPTNLGPFDHVCCGNMGVVALLRTAARTLHRPEWLTAAQDMAQRVVDRAARRRSYAVCPVDDVFSPGYYDGLAGVGYELLGLQTPDLPSVLLWE
jgi:lantibiotic modifying enzyme